MARTIKSVTRGKTASEGVADSSTSIDSTSGEGENKGENKKEEAENEQDGEEGPETKEEIKTEGDVPAITAAEEENSDTSGAVTGVAEPPLVVAEVTTLEVRNLFILSPKKCKISQKLDLRCPIGDMQVKRHVCGLGHAVAPVRF